MNCLCLSNLGHFDSFYGHLTTPAQIKLIHRVKIYTYGLYLRMTDFVAINSIEQLDERHATELEHLEAKLKRLQIAKKAAKKERESMKKKHEDEKAKLLFSEDDQIELEKLDLRFGFPIPTIFYPLFKPGRASGRYSSAK